MEQQLSFAESEYLHKRHDTRKEKFPAQMKELVPWQRLAAVIETHSPKVVSGRRPSVDDDTAHPLHAAVVQPVWSGNFGDPAMEDALYEIASIQLFGGGLSLEPICQEIGRQAPKTVRNSGDSILISTYAFPLGPGRLGSSTFPVILSGGHDSALDNKPRPPILLRS